MAAKSPLAPARFPTLPAVAGAEWASLASGIRYTGRADLVLGAFRPGTAVAGVLTRSATAAPPVAWCRAALPGGRARALVVNSGNANSFTGDAGLAAVRRTADAARAAVWCRAREVFVASTGVIGVPLPVDKIAAALPRLKAKLSPTGWRGAAQAIMTTDTFAKGATRAADVAGRAVILNGIAKGSGMIAPDMATMLAFIVTDLAIPAVVLRTLLRAANRKSFNCITVDSDTSTSDTALLFATGAVRPRPAITSATDPRLKGFRAALLALMTDLAHQIVRDGEGASKFITVTVIGAESARAARVIAMSIANSPLVKTAVAGEDANWGRIVMAVGKAGERIDAARLAISVGGIAITEHGWLRPDYDETPVALHMKGSDIELAADVGVGRGRATVWTCDLTHGYIDINADYRS